MTEIWRKNWNEKNRNLYKHNTVSSSLRFYAVYEWGGTFLFITPLRQNSHQRLKPVHAEFNAISRTVGRSTINRRLSLLVSLVHSVLGDHRRQKNVLFGKRILCLFTFVTLYTAAKIMLQRCEHWCHEWLNIDTVTEEKRKHFSTTLFQPYRWHFVA